MAFVVTALWTAKPGNENEVAVAVAELVEPSRNEPGVILYQPHRDPEDPCRFFFYEQYVDKAAYEAHGASDHFKKFGFGVAIPLLESRERAFYETWAPAAPAGA
jgi:quinol monooxygenase YgiN